jgi:endonuclease-3 related protein
MRATLFSIYQKLYAYFGPQHWWPADTPFEVMLGAILTQNTNWSNVEKAIYNLKANNLLDPFRLNKIPHKKLASLIRSAGYYNIKAKRLKEFLSFFLNLYKCDIGKMKRQDTGMLREQLLAIKGVGPETADSILLYALNKPIFVVDAYTKRIFTRHGLLEENANYAQVQNFFMQNLNPVTNIKSTKKKNKICNGARNEASRVRNTNKSYRKNISNVVKLFNEFHALLVRLGKEFCLKSKPKCNICPLNDK